VRDSQDGTLVYGNSLKNSSRIQLSNSIIPEGPLETLIPQHTGRLFLNRLKLEVVEEDSEVESDDDAPRRAFPLSPDARRALEVDDVNRPNISPKTLPKSPLIRKIFPVDLLYYLKSAAKYSLYRKRFSVEVYCDL
jgi:hypothetical protein